MKLVKQIIYAMIASFLSFLINISILFILTEYIGVYYVVSALISNSLAAIFGFTYNKNVTFQHKGKYLIKSLQFFFINSCAIAINILLLYSFTELGMYYLVSQIIASIITFSIGFLFLKHWIFKK